MSFRKLEEMETQRWEENHVFRPSSKIAFHPNLGVGLANFPSFFLLDGSKLGRPVLSTFEMTAQCLDNKHHLGVLV